MNIYIQCRIFAHVQVKLHERNFKFRQLPRKTTIHLKANVGRLYNISTFVFLTFCLNNLLTETEQISKICRFILE